MPKPQPGDKIYVFSTQHLNHGIDDFRGGLCTVAATETKRQADREVIFEEIEEDPGRWILWETYLEPKQESLKTAFVGQQGHLNPDLRPEFNTITDGSPTLTNDGKIASHSRMNWPSMLLSVVLGCLTACASHTSPPPKTVESDAASSNKPPLVIHNPDGTFTVQKEPPKGEAEDAKAKSGLVIPPQVVVPITPAPEKRN